MERIKAYLSLGSNIGDRKLNLIKAIKLLANYKGIIIESVSNIYETNPVGYVNQGKFLNMIVKISTEIIDALEFLHFIHEIETIMGRERLIRWGPRNIDIDILFFGNVKIDSNDLTIPHKEMFNRAFVLKPLSDLVEDYDLFNIDFEDAILKCEDKENVNLFIKKECLNQIFKEINLER